MLKSNKWVQIGLILLLVSIWGFNFKTLVFKNAEHKYKSNAFSVDSLKNKLESFQFSYSFILPKKIRNPFISVASQPTIQQPQPILLETIQEVIDFSPVSLKGIIGKTMHIEINGIEYLISNNVDTNGYHFEILSPDSILVQRKQSQIILKLF